MSGFSVSTDISNTLGVDLILILLQTCIGIMVVNWKTAESQERLLACVVASFLPAKVDCNKVAKLFGQDVTAGAIGFQFQAIRKMAGKLVEGADGAANSGK